MKLSNFKLVNKKNLVASFDIELPSGLVIYGAMLLRAGDKQWIAFPGKPYVKDGVPTYSRLLAIPCRHRKDSFDRQVFAALKADGHI